MIPAFLITFREVIEASLIVATILGILVKLKQHNCVKTVWLGTSSAIAVSIFLLLGASVLGLRIQKLYTGKTEELIEGILMVVSAVFITWAVFWLHTYFGRHKLALLQRVRSTIESEKQLGLFVLVFTAVFREGFEIVLFLTTIYLSASPLAVLSGFATGALAGLLLAIGLFTATIKMPIYRTFQATTVLLVLFAAGLLGRGIHEFTEAGLLPELAKITVPLLPASGHIVSELSKAFFGWTRSMDQLQLASYAFYIGIMRWFLYRKRPLKTT